MSFWNNCCCETGDCQIFKKEWDGSTANTFEFKKMVDRGSSVLRRIDSDGSTLAYHNVSAPFPALVTPRQSPCLEIETSVKWTDSPGDYFTSYYFFGQTYDELKFIPSGQNYLWNGSIDFSVRYLERRVNLSSTNTGVLSAFADASLTPPAGSFEQFKSVKLWLAARQNGQVYLKRFNADAPILPWGLPGTIFVEGRSGNPYPLPDSSPYWGLLKTGDWIRFVATGSQEFLNTRKETQIVGSPHVWITPQSADGPYQFAYDYADLDWCGGASPIYFGWAISLEGPQHSRVGYEYRVETLSKQTIRIDRICLNINETPTPACPCFDSCFQFDWPGGSIEFTNSVDGTVETNEAGEATVFLPRLQWDPTGNPLNTDFSQTGAGWCKFGTAAFEPGKAATDLDGWLWVHKGSRRALVRVLVQKVEVWFASTDFTYEGAKFVRTELVDWGGIRALSDYLHWMTIEDLSDPTGYNQRDTSEVTDDSLPGAFEVTAIRCNGQEMGEDVAAGSCTGACVYVAEFVPPGDYRWKYEGDPSVNPCETECRCFETLYLTEGRYGVPLHADDRLYLNCVPRSNHAPRGTSAVVTIARNTSWIFEASDFGFTDPYDTPPDSLLAVKITTLPARGSLRLNGDLITAGKVIAVHDLDEGNLIFSPEKDAFASPYAVIWFKVIDNGGTDRGGFDTDASETSFLFNVT